MASWISVYCRTSVGAITPAALLAGIQDRDPSASAGIDYLTLAEDYDVDEDVVESALECLRVESASKTFDTYEVHYTKPAKRPVFVRRWTDASEHVDEELERKKRPPKLVTRMRATVEAIGIELGASQLTDFGIVVAYEIARFLAQKGDGVIVDLQHEWNEVRDGAFKTL
jgi:hypothetical protein